MRQYHIYGIGAALVDTEIEVTNDDLKKLGIEKGLMTLVDEPRQQELITYLSGHLTASKRASGGSGANSIIGASYFGAKTFYSCKVSDDDNGNFYLKDMASAGVVCNRNDQPHASGANTGVTGKCLVLITPDAERTMLTHLGISATLSENELDLSAAKNSEYIYLEGYLVTSPGAKAAAIKLRQAAEAHQVKTAISLSDPGMVEFFGDGLKEMIGDKVDLLFCNEHEAMGFVGAKTVPDAAEGLKKYTRAFAITLGSRGALVFDGNTYHPIAAHPVTAVDTNGAGDMFAGAFLYAITHGHDYASAGKLASRASAEVVSDFGPRLRPEQHQQILKTVWTNIA
jgi:sugar/nucleoside kinase (ribokinase family)